jgi:uncharacterized membrane protein
MNPAFYVSIASSFTAIALLAVVFFKNAKAPAPGHPNWTAEQMRPFMLWGLLYVNPHDSRNFPPKVSGLGWTINFREKRHAYLFAALIILNLATAIWMSVTVVGAAP